MSSKRIAKASKSATKPSIHTSPTGKACNFIPHDVYYSDTDSCLTSYGDYPDVKELGGLKKEYKEEITIECFAPKMYRLTKATPFSGEHVRKGEKQCLVLCSGCEKDAEGKLIKKQHALNQKGQRDCLKTCPGCSCEKIMMKGFPKDYRTSETLAKLQRHEEIEYEQHEKLGVLAKKGFRETPRMATIKKSWKSVYDKRTMDPESGDTKPIILDDVRYLSGQFKDVATSARYKIPDWLSEIVHLHDPIKVRA